MDWKPILKKSLIKILILIIIMSLLYVAVRIIYTKGQVYPNSSDIALSVIDGDTFETSDGEIIRLLCVDTPEQNKEGYTQARDFLLSSLINGEVLIERQGTDQYNRTLAWVSVNKSGEIILINKEIVDQGFGTLFEYNGTDCGRMK